MLTAQARAVQRRGWGLACAAVVVVRPVSAQPVAAAPVEVARPLASATPVIPRITQLVVDNDLFALRDSGPPTDRDYTHGLTVTVHWAGLPARVAGLVRRWPSCTARLGTSDEPCLRFAAGARQAIYTPASNEDRRRAGERPHAGLLAAHAALTRVTAHRQLQLRAELGTTGALSLAAPLQKAMHYVTGSSPQRGWQHQLGTRPVVDVDVDDSWQYDVRAPGSRVRLVGRWGAQLGTLRTAARTEAEVRVGADRVGLGLPIDGAHALARGGFVRASVRQEVIARDLFVDGHFGDRSLSTVREPSVWQTSVGVGWRFAGGMTEFQHVRRGREYAAQPGPHSYGSLRFTWYHR
jgi:hypothetical protein